MRLCHLIAVLASHCAATANADYIQEFFQARSVEKSDPQASVDGMVRSFHQAVEAKDCEYASVAGLNACLGIYGQGKVVECGTMAREIISALVPLEDLYPESTTLRSVQLFGYMERGLLAEGKVGAAWQANRAAAERLRGKKVSATADGPSVTLADLDSLTPTLRIYGLRLIEREANLLDISGRSNEARTLLDAAATWLGKDWQTRLEPTERFYAFKLLAARAELIDFLGYHQEAIQAEQDLVQAVGGQGIFEQSHRTLRINLLRNLSQWSGPSQEILDQARDIAAQMKTRAVDNQVDRLLAKMEFDFKQSREPIESLRRQALKNQALGDSFEATYSERDGLFARVSLGEANLDAEFHQLLRKIRSYGNKRGEPSLFRSFGSYFRTQVDRDAIALATSGATVGDDLCVARFRWQGKVDDLPGYILGGRQRVLVFSRKGLGAHQGAHRAGAEQVHADVRACALQGIGLDQHIQRRLGGAVGSPIGTGIRGGTGGDKDRASRIGCLQQRIEELDQAQVCVDVDVDGLDPVLGVDLVHGRQGAEHAGIADEDIKLAPAFCDRACEAWEGWTVLEIKRHKRRRATVASDLVIEFFQAANCSRQGDDVGAFACKCHCGCATDTS